MNKYAIVDSSDSSKSSWKWQHPRRRVGVVQLAPDAPDGYTPPMLSSRSRHVEQVMRTWECCYVGKTERCQYQQALAEAEAMIADLQT